VSVPPIESYAVLDSTNAEARRRAEAGVFGPVWIHALEQTAGRGRRGRAWRGGGGNLAATLLTPVDLPPAQAAQISFVAAVALCETVNALAGAPVARLRWPNDLYVAGGKAAGILVESGPRTGRGQWLADGICVNLAEAPPRDQDERPAPAMAHIAERMMSHYQGFLLGYSVYCCPDPAQLSAYLGAVHPQIVFGVPRVWEKIYNGVNAALSADPARKAQFAAFAGGQKHIEECPVFLLFVADLARLVAKDAPHQGLVLECAPLEDVFLDIARDRRRAAVAAD
jgi:hypothetical protein